MNKDLQKLCASTGIIGILLFFIGILIAGWLPLPSPGMSASAVSEMYQQNTTAIRLCGVFMLASAFFTAPFYAAISMQIRRMEGSARPVMSYAQLCAGGAGIWTFAIPGLFFIIAAFRPERSAEATQTLNDFGWIFATTPWPMMAFQAIALGITILKHPATATLPRWLAFFNFWVALLLLPGSLVPFFKSGPFAWNGIIAFYIPAVVFGLWYIVLQIELFKAIERDNGL